MIKVLFGKHCKKQGQTEDSTDCVLECFKNITDSSQAQEPMLKNLVTWYSGPQAK